jgi:hypothetical protein
MSQRGKAHGGRTPQANNVQTGKAGQRITVLIDAPVPHLVVSQVGRLASGCAQHIGGLSKGRCMLKAAVSTQKVHPAIHQDSGKGGGFKALTMCRKPVAAYLGPLPNV